jgi:predicted heme/steroid binding protein/uncharacterized membrane protein
MKETDLEELAANDGQEGKAVFIAHQGKVYDVSASKLWKGGLHMKRHHAGRDLTTDIQSAPHGPEMLERYPQVAVLKKKEAAERAIPEFLSRLLTRFPMLRRHPHPMTIHFPIVFMFATTLFNGLYLVTGSRSFEWTALHCLGAGILFIPVAMATGYFTWWLNYLARPVRAVAIKKKLSTILLVIAVLAFGWRVAVPDIFQVFSLSGLVYGLLILSLLPLVSVIGWFGASLTFPVERE